MCQSGEARQEFIKTSKILFASSNCNFSKLVFAYVVNKTQLNVIETHFNKNVYLHADMHVFSLNKMLKGALCNFVQN